MEFLGALVSGLVGAALWYKLGGVEAKVNDIIKRLDRNKIF